MSVYFTFTLFTTPLRASLLEVMLNLSMNSIMVPNFSLLKLYFCRKVSAFRSRVENIPAIIEANDIKLQNLLYFQYVAYESRIMLSFLKRLFTIVFTVIGINQTENIFFSYAESAFNKHS